MFEAEPTITAAGVKILSELQVGAGNAVTSRHLREMTGLTERSLREEVRNLRMIGYTICSTTIPPGGYFFPGDPVETSTFVESMSHRGRAILEVAHFQGRNQKE